MSKDVKEAFIDILSEYFQDKGVYLKFIVQWCTYHIITVSPVAAAEEVLIAMQENRHYILDIWT